jgi:hypothetical protein
MFSGKGQRQGERKRGKKEKESEIRSGEGKKVGKELEAKIS